MEKTWTATDVKQGVLTIIPQEGYLSVERVYRLVDIEGTILEQVREGRIAVDVPFPDIPLDILSALQKIDAWTYAQALEREGL